MRIKSVEVGWILPRAHTRRPVNIQRVIKKSYPHIHNLLYTNDLAPLDKARPPVYIPLMTNFFKNHPLIVIANILCAGFFGMAWYVTGYFPLGLAGLWMGLNLGYTCPRGDHD